MSEFEQGQPQQPDGPGQPPAAQDHQQASSEHRPPLGDPASANRYGDWWENCWDQPPIAELPASAESAWAAPAVGQQHGYPPPASYPPPADYPVSASYPVPVGFQPYVPPGRRRRRPWLLGAVAAVLVLVFGGGGLAAYQVLNGGGVQPEQVVPSDATAFFKVDLNPSAAQKVNAARLLHRLPKLGSLTGSGDWREQMFQSLAEDGAVPPGISYDRGIKSWLGERAAVAMVPDSSRGTAEPLLVLQCTDDGKARTALARVGLSGGVSFYRGYAVIAPSQPAADQAVAEAKVLSLAGSRTYRADFGQLGASGIVAGWVDLGAAQQMPGVLGTPGLTSSGQLAFTIRVSPDAIDLIGRLNGVAGSPQPAPDLGGLPADTTIAAAAAVDPAAINRSWHQYQDMFDKTGVLLNAGDAQGAESLRSIEQQFGLRLPADLTAVLGSGLTVSVAPGSPSRFAVRTHTDGAAAGRVLDRIRASAQAHGEDFPLTYRTTSTGLLVANDPSYLAALDAGGSARLSSVKSFRAALPEASGASLTAFVNIEAIVAELRAKPDNADDLGALSAFSAAGLTVRTQAGWTSLHLRLLAH